MPRNPVESIFAGVRLRTNAAKRMRNREAALYLVFKVVERLSQNWRGLNGGQNLMALVLVEAASSATGSGTGSEGRGRRNRFRPASRPKSTEPLEGNFHKI